MGVHVESVERACSDCGRKYRLKKTNVPMRDKDELRCRCGSVLISWNGGVIYSIDEEVPDGE